MKKLFITLALIGATLPALAQHHGYGIRHNHHHHGHHRGYHSGPNWVAPLVIGGVVTYALTRPDPVVVQQPIIIQQDQPSVILNQNCTPWKEVYTSDGKIYRERTCTD